MHLKNVFLPEFIQNVRFCLLFGKLRHSSSDSQKEKTSKKCSFPKSTMESMEPMSVTQDNNNIYIKNPDGTLTLLDKDLAEKIRVLGNGGSSSVLLGGDEPATTTAANVSLLQTPVQSSSNISAFASPSFNTPLLGGKVASTPGFTAPRRSSSSTVTSTEAVRSKDPRQRVSGRSFKTGSMLLFFPHDKEDSICGAGSVFMYGLRQIKSGMKLDLTKVLSDRERADTLELAFYGEEGVHTAHAIARVEEGISTNVQMDAVDQVRRWLQASALHHGADGAILVRLLILAFPEHIYCDYTYPNRVLGEVPLRVELTEGHERWITDEEGPATTPLNLTEEDRNYFQLEKVLLVAQQEGLHRGRIHQDEASRRSARLAKQVLTPGQKKATPPPGQPQQQKASGGKRAAGGKGGGGAGRGGDDGEGSDSDRLPGSSTTESSSEDDEGKPKKRKKKAVKRRASKRLKGKKTSEEEDDEEVAAVEEGQEEQDSSYEPPAHVVVPSTSRGITSSTPIRGRKETLPKAYGGKGRGGKGASRGKGTEKGKSSANTSVLRQMMTAEEQEDPPALSQEDQREMDEAFILGGSSHDLSPSASTSAVGSAKDREEEEQFEVVEESAKQKSRQVGAYAKAGKDARQVMI